MVAEQTFMCGNCGRVFPISEEVRVPLADRVVLLLPFGPVPARVCHACTGQVGFAVSAGVVLALVAAVFLVLWLVA